MEIDLGDVAPCIKPTRGRNCYRLDPCVGCSVTGKLLDCQLLTMINHNAVDTNVLFDVAHDYHRVTRSITSWYLWCCETVQSPTYICILG